MIGRRRRRAGAGQMAVSLVVLPIAPVFVSAMAVVAAGQRLLATTTCGVPERHLRLLQWFRRLSIRWEIRDDIHQAFVILGCAIICSRRLRASVGSAAA